MTSRSSENLQELGLQATRHIYAFEIFKDERHINELFKILVEMGMIIQSYSYKGIPSHIKKEAIQQLSEDILLRVYRNPEKFSHIENFFFYYKIAVKYSFFNIIRSLGQQIWIIHADDWEKLHIDHSWGPGYVHPPDYLWIKRGKCQLLIHFVAKTIKSFPRFRNRGKFLIWPVITYIMQEDKTLWSSLNFRDRIGLKAIVQAVPFKVIHQCTSP